MVIQSERAPPTSYSTKYLDRTKMNNALNNALAFGASYAEIRLMAETTSSVRLKDGQLEHAIPGQEIGATLRILADGAWGVHSTTDISNIPNEIEATVRLAKAVAARRPSGSNPIQLAEIPIHQDEIHWKSKKDVRNTDLDTKLSMLDNIHQSANDDERIISVSCGWSDEHLHTELLTTEGMDRTWSFQRSMVNGMVTARDGGDPVSYRMRHGGEGGLELIEDCDLQTLGADARIAALRLLKAKRSPSGKLPLIADRDLTGVYIHEALGHPCEADLVAAGDSCLDGKLGQKIGNEIVTVVDDPTLRGGYGAYPIDG